MNFAIGNLGEMEISNFKNGRKNETENYYLFISSFIYLICFTNLICL